MNIREVISTIPYNYTCKWFYKKPRVMSTEKTIQYIVNNRVSISRFGDGEMRLMFDYDLNFQMADEKLKKKLKEVKTTKKCLCCIPNIFSKKVFSKKIIKRDEYYFWVKHKAKYEVQYRKMFSKINILGDSFVSRFYMRYIDKSKEKVKEIVDSLKEIWDKRDIVFIEGKNSRLGYGNDLFDNALSVKRILCPVQNAFSVYDDIMKSIKLNCKRNDLIILALGPTATVMAYELSEMGYQALDLGHIDIEYEWYLLGVDNKVPIPYKHVNECDSLGNENIILDKDYKNQIIDKIGLE